MKVKVTVTQQDHDEGVPNTAAKCDVACALKRILAPDVHVIVTHIHAYFNATADKRYISERARVSKNMARFIRKVDAGTVTPADLPASFVMEIPEELLNKG